MTADKEKKKDWYIRALITKVCQEGQLPDIKYEEFFLGRYATLFKKLVERKSDLPSVAYLVDKYGFEKEDSEMKLTDIIEELHNFYVQEKFTKIVQDAVKSTRENNGNIIITLDKIAKEFSETRQVVTKAFTVNIAKDVDRITEEYKKSGEQGEPIITGFEKVDQYVRPRAGNLFIVCGGTGGGKTLTMVQMQKAAILSGVPSMYFSLEMGVIEMTNRLLAAMGRFKFSDLHNNYVPIDEYRKAIEDLNKTQAHIITRQSESKIDLLTIERYIIEHKPRVVFIDYVTLIDGADSSWNAEVSITGTLKRIALQNSCLIVCAAQADTETIKSGEIPTMISTRYNKALADDCDIFLGLASQRYAADQDKMKVNYAIRKSRNGGFPEFSYRVAPNTGNWEDSTGQEY